MKGSRGGIEVAAGRLIVEAQGLDSDAALADERAMEAQQRATKARNLLERLRITAFSSEGAIRERASSEAVSWRREENEVRREEVGPALDRSLRFRSSHSARRLMDTDEQVGERQQVETVLRLAESAPPNVTRQVAQVEERLYAVLQRSEKASERVREWAEGLSDLAGEG